MVKKISLFLSVLLIFALLLTPVSAEETINDLKKIYNNLQTHLYTPYYKDSLKYNAYKETMDEIKALLASDAITQAEISKYYNELRTVYSDLMRDTYDYSSLEMLITAFDSLDSSIFTPDSWKKLLSTRDTAQKELSAPTLFVRGDNITAAQYSKHIQDHIASIEEEFASAFNELVLIEKPEQMTKNYLLGYKKYVQFCSREELLGKAASWKDLQSSLSEAENITLLPDASQTQLNVAYLNISSAYVSACSSSYSFASSNQLLSEFEKMSAENYSPASWKRYEEEITLLKERITKTPYFFIPLNADEKVCKEYAEKYQNNFGTSAETLKDILVSIDTYNTLFNLCETHKNATAMEGLEIKLSFLKTTIKDGEAVLANEHASLKDYEEAIKKINAAKEDLDLAEKFLSEEKGKVTKQDPTTSRITIIIVVAVLILSLAFAIILSRHYFGRTRW